MNITSSIPKIQKQQKNATGVIFKIKYSKI